MLDPRDFIDHAERLLSAAPDSEVDIRRAISATYYALFHLLTGDAASRFAGDSTALHARIRRGIDHSSVRKLCNTVTAAKGTVPKLLEGLLAAPSPRLVGIAAAFGELQDTRHAADYDLSALPTLEDARSSLALARSAFDDWAVIQADPEAHVFLAAILLSDRWTRRG